MTATWRPAARRGDPAPPPRGRRADPRRDEPSRRSHGPGDRPAPLRRRRRTLASPHAARRIPRPVRHEARSPVRGRHHHRHPLGRSTRSSPDARRVLRPRDGPRHPPPGRAVRPQRSRPAPDHLDLTHLAPAPPARPRHGHRRDGPRGDRASSTGRTDRGWTGRPHPDPHVGRPSRCHQRSHHGRVPPRRAATRHRDEGRATVDRRVEAWEEGTCPASGRRSRERTRQTVGKRREGHPDWGAPLD